jgi:hypothetical protein
LVTSSTHARTGCHCQFRSGDFVPIRVAYGSDVGVATVDVINTLLAHTLHMQRLLWRRQIEKPNVRTQSEGVVRRVEVEWSLVSDSVVSTSAAALWNDRDQPDCDQGLGVSAQEGVACGPLAARRLAYAPWQAGTCRARAFLFVENRQ